MKTQAANGQMREFQDTGRWSVAGNQLVFETSNSTDRCDFSLQNGQLSIYFPKLDTTITFVRMK
jgi:hypothetical protein